MKAWAFSIGLDSPRGFTAQGATKVASLYVPDKGIFNYSFNGDGTVDIGLCFIKDPKILKKVQETLETPKSERGLGDTYGFIRNEDPVKLPKDLVDKAVTSANSFQEQIRLYNQNRIPYDLQLRRTKKAPKRIAQLEEALKPIGQELQRRRESFVLGVEELVKIAALQIPLTGQV